jgi:hypothetical protein
VSAMGFGAYCFHRFGVPWPVTHSEEYGFDYMKAFPRMLQILLDRRQGWIWLFPAAIMLPLACVGVCRCKETRWWGILVGVVILVSLFFIAVFNDWQGGTNPRGRFYVIPQLYGVPLLLVWLKQNRRWAPRALLCFLGALSVAMLIWLLPHPHWWYRNYHPFFAWEQIQVWYFWLPDLSDGAGPRQWLKALCALAGIIAVSAAFLTVPWARLTGRAAETAPKGDDQPAP